MNHIDIDFFSLGDRVNRSRRAMGFTQAELARAARVTASFIGHIERAEKIPSLETVARLSRALEVTMDWLVLGEKVRCEGQRCPLYGELEALLRAYGVNGKE